MFHIHRKGDDIIQGLMYVVLLSIALLLVIVDILSQKKKRRIRNVSLVNKLEKTSRNKYIKWMHDKPNSKKYKKIKAQIKQAGFNISPELVQFLSYLLPAIMFLFIIAIRYTNMLNAMMNIDQLKKVAEVLGDSSIAQINTKTNWGLVLAGAFLFHYVPTGVLKVVGTFRNAKSQKEVIMLQTYAIMMLKTGKSVKQILITLMDRSDTFKAYIEKAVNNYSHNPQLALKELRENVGNKDFDKIITSLEQALKSDRQISLKYLENHRVLGKELNRINRRGRNAKKNVVGILLMIIPLLTLILVGGYPWFIFSLKVLDEVPI
jgi:hypothetical protein